MTSQTADASKIWRPTADASGREISAPSLPVGNIGDCEHLGTGLSRAQGFWTEVCLDCKAVFPARPREEPTPVDVATTLKFLAHMMREMRDCGTWDALTMARVVENVDMAVRDLLPVVEHLSLSPLPAGVSILWSCKKCNSPRAVNPCQKCGTALTKPAKGWKWPRLPDIDRIRELARDVGYAIGVHGSLERDFDLIAAPWVSEAVAPLALAQHIAAGLGGEVVDHLTQDKPCGRWSCNIHTPDWTKLIDLSVMAPAAAPDGMREVLQGLLTEAEAMIVEIDGERGRCRETADEILADPDLAECFSAVRRARAILALSATPEARQEGGWQDIATAMTDAPHWISDTGTRHISEVLVYGPTWQGGWEHSPYDKGVADMFTGESGIFIAYTYEGALCWTAFNPGPSDYDEHVRPTHWQPLPKPPTAAEGDQDNG